VLDDDDVIEEYWRDVALSRILGDVGVSPAEYAVLWHVRDTVVQPRDVIAAWVAANLPNHVPTEITVDDCLAATDSLIRRGLLAELTAADIEADLARWRAEPLPVSWSVDRDRRPGDVDLTEPGFRLIEAITQRLRPDRERLPRVGYKDEARDEIRVFGETEESCRRTVANVVARIDQTPWRWPRDSVHVDAIHTLGPWWCSRYEQVPGGFEVVVRRREPR
jgi:hypothetical protein